MILALLASCGLSTKPQPDVVLVVLDTVRADHTSLCGYERPTTPELATFGAQGTVSCDAKSPGNWTVPSHASYFTGLPIEAHGAGMGPDRTEVTFGVRPMRQDVRTLAEDFTARGYQTVLVSANGLVSEKTGLARGFATVNTRQGDAEWRERALTDQLRTTLATVTPNKPLFLVVNILDAHDPWPAIPAGLDWVPTRPALDGVRARKRYEAGRIRAAARGPFLQRVTDAYDPGVSLADASFARAMDVTRQAGFLKGDWRVVVTSDHGEFLGEHGRILHNGLELYEPVVSIPLIYVDSAGTRPSLPAPVSGLVVHSLVRDGTVPDSLPPVRSGHLTSRRSEAPLDAERCWNISAAEWTGSLKHTCVRGKSFQVELAADPAEARPTTAPLGALTETVEALEALDALDQEAAPVGDALKALGYVE